MRMFLLTPVDCITLSLLALNALSLTSKHYAFCFKFVLFMTFFKTIYTSFIFF